jgi:hypothetical protein
MRRSKRTSGENIIEKTEEERNKKKGKEDSN